MSCQLLTIFYNLLYGLVPYNISPIQQGIQFGHAVVEYLLKNKVWYDLSYTFENYSEIQDDKMFSSVCEFFLLKKPILSPGFVKPPALNK